MQQLINQLCLSLFQKPLQDCSSEEFAATSLKKYPYYPVTQLLYASKIKQDNPENYPAVLQKTVLYFNNPLWLQWLFTASDLPPLADVSPSGTASLPWEDVTNDEQVVVNPVHRFDKEKLELKNTAVNKSSRIPEKNEDTPFLFEPYHTVDYFASQGIKTIPEEKPQDRFGRQLKSFTEWLKTLKTAGPQESVPPSDKKSEEAVIHLADHSISDTTIETEAMAEVWIKQGHPEKALAIYQKLSLLNPSKSSYFASLIENLKQS